ncbi:type II secretion system protein N [Novosphingobium tardum]|uniref:Type II secretion system protein N n=1 Tax=Novosphingobium tardum TaxID=1538021 RepID=A0ABV8RRN3_9SPHN
MRERFSFAGARSSRLGLHDVLWWALAALIAILGAQLAWMIVTPVSPLGDWRPATVRVLSPQARAALFAGFDPFNRNRTVQGTATVDVVTSLALTLFGVRVNAATGGGSAIISGADGIQHVYRVGTEVMPGVTLAGVAFDHVSLSHNGNNELLYLDQSKPATNAQAVVAGSNQPQPQPAQPSQALTVDGLRRGVSFQPRAENGRVMGLEVSATADGGAFRAAGFLPGDVITSVGGKAVTSPADGAALAASLKPGGAVTVMVRRGGQQLPLAISLAQ